MVTSATKAYKSSFKKLSRNNENGAENFSSPIVNYVESNNIDGINYTTIYTEVDTGLNIGDYIYIVNGNYDTYKLIEEYEYQYGTYGYKILDIDKCKITIDIEYNGKLPYETDEYDNFIKIHVANNQEELNYEVLSNGFYPFKYMLNVDYNNNILFNSLTNEFLVADSNNNVADIANWTLVDLFNNILPADFASNNGKFMPISDFTYNGVTYKKDLVYKYNGNTWIIDNEYEKAFLSKGSYRKGTFNNGTWNDGIYGQNDTVINWNPSATYSNAIWKSGVFYNSIWNFGNMDSKSDSITKQNYYAFLDENDQINQSTDFNNNSGYGYNYAFNSDFIANIEIKNGNFFNCNVGEYNQPLKLIQDYFINGTYSTPSVIIENGRYNKSNIMGASVSDGLYEYSVFENTVSSNSTYNQSDIRYSIVDGEINNLGTLDILAYDKLLTSTDFLYENVNLSLEDNFTGTFSNLVVNHKFYISESDFKTIKSRGKILLNELVTNNPSFLDLFDNNLYFDSNLIGGFYNSDNYGEDLKIMVKLTSKYQNENVRILQPSDIFPNLITDTNPNLLPSIDVYILSNDVNVNAVLADYRSINTTQDPNLVMSVTDISDSTAQIGELYKSLYNGGNWKSSKVNNPDYRIERILDNSALNIEKLSPDTIEVNLDLMSGKSFDIQENDVVFLDNISHINDIADYVNLTGEYYVSEVKTSSIILTDLNNIVQDIVPNNITILNDSDILPPDWDYDTIGVVITPASVTKLGDVSTFTTGIENSGITSSSTYFYNIDELGGVVSPSTSITFSQGRYNLEYEFTESDNLSSFEIILQFDSQPNVSKEHLPSGTGSYNLAFEVDVDQQVQMFISIISVDNNNTAYINLKNINIKSINSLFVSTPLLIDGDFDLSETQDVFNSIHLEKIENTDINEGLLKRALINNSVYNNESIIQSTDLQDVDVNRLNISETILSASNSNTINSTLFSRSYISQQEIQGSIVYNSILKENNNNNGIVLESKWISGTVNDGNILGLNKTVISDPTTNDYFVNTLTLAEWNEGVFNNGTFFNSVWDTGVFNNGEFYNSIFASGTFNDGIFGNTSYPNNASKFGDYTYTFESVILNGNPAPVWNNGKFINGYFGIGQKSSAILITTWNDGMFENGVIRGYEPNLYNEPTTIWNNGTFNDGDIIGWVQWNNGTFNGGNFLSAYGGGYGTYSQNTDNDNTGYAWVDGIFNGGKFGNVSGIIETDSILTNDPIATTYENPSWMDGRFTSGDFYGKIWNDGIFTGGNFNGNTDTNYGEILTDYITDINDNGNISSSISGWNIISFTSSVTISNNPLYNESPNPLISITQVAKPFEDKYLTFESLSSTYSITIESNPITYNITNVEIPYLISRNDNDDNQGDVVLKYTLDDDEFILGTMSWEYNVVPAIGIFIFDNIYVPSGSKLTLDIINTNDIDQMLINIADFRYHTDNYVKNAKDFPDNFVMSYSDIGDEKQYGLWRSGLVINDDATTTDTKDLVEKTNLTRSLKQFRKDKKADINFKDMLWVSGTFSAGTMDNSIFLDGKFNNANFNNSNFNPYVPRWNFTYYGGSSQSINPGYYTYQLEDNKVFWMGGVLDNSNFNMADWYQGTFKSGDMVGGYWKSGVAENINVYNSIWEGGVIYNANWYGCDNVLLDMYLGSYVSAPSATAISLVKYDISNYDVMIKNMQRMDSRYVRLENITVAEMYKDNDDKVKIAPDSYEYNASNYNGGSYSFAYTSKNIAYEGDQGPLIGVNEYIPMSDEPSTVTYSTDISTNNYPTQVLYNNCNFDNSVIGYERITDQFGFSDLTGNTSSYGGYDTYKTLGFTAGSYTRIGNGVFLEGIVENIAWNNGPWEDNPYFIYGTSGYYKPGYLWDQPTTNINLDGESFNQKGGYFTEVTNAYETSNDIWVVELKTIDPLTMNYIEVGDNIAIGNIVSQTVNDRRQVLKDYYKITYKDDVNNIIRVTIKVPFPIRTITKDSENHVIYVTKRIWNDGTFHNGTFEGVWNSGTVDGYPFTTEIRNTQIIDGTIKGGKYSTRLVDNINNITIDEYSTGVIQESYIHALNTFEEDKFDTWMDINWQPSFNYMNFEEVNLIDLKKQKYANSLDVLSSVMNIWENDADTTSRKNYNMNLGSKSNKYDYLIDDNFDQIFPPERLEDIGYTFSWWNGSTKLEGFGTLFDSEILPDYQEKFLPYNDVGIPVDSIQFKSDNIPLSNTASGYTSSYIISNTDTINATRFRYYDISYDVNDIEYPTSNQSFINSYPDKGQWEFLDGLFDGGNVSWISYQKPPFNVGDTIVIYDFIPSYYNGETTILSIDKLDVGVNYLAGGLELEVNSVQWLVRTDKAFGASFNAARGFAYKKIELGEYKSYAYNLNRNDSLIMLGDPLLDLVYINIDNIKVQEVDKIPFYDYYNISEYDFVTKSPSNIDNVLKQPKSSILEVISTLDTDVKFIDNKKRSE